MRRRSNTDKEPDPGSTSDPDILARAPADSGTRGLVTARSGRWTSP